MSRPYPMGLPPPSYSEVSMGVPVTSNYDQPPPAYDDIVSSPQVEERGVHLEETGVHAEEGGASAEEERPPVEYRVEYRSGVPHINYGLTLVEGRIESVAPGSTAAESQVQAGGRILRINGVDHRPHGHTAILRHLVAEYERFSSLMLLLDYSNREYGENWRPPPQQQDIDSEVKEFHVQYKPGNFDSHYGIIISDCRIKSVCPGTVGSLAGVSSGGRIVKVNGTDVRWKGHDVIMRLLTDAYEREDNLTLVVAYPASEASPVPAEPAQPLAPVNRPSYTIRRFCIPYAEAMYGLAFSDTTITEVLPGSRAQRVGILKGGTLLTINGVSVNQINAGLLQHIALIHDNRRDLELEIQYPDEDRRQASGNELPQSRVIDSQPRREPEHANRTTTVSHTDTQNPYGSSYADTPQRLRYTGRRDLSWGPRITIMSTKEIFCLVFWSAISLACFPPTGFPALCFTVWAANSFNEDDMKFRRRGAICSNILSCVCGSILIIVLIVVFAT